MRNQSLALVVVAAGTVLAATIPAAATGGSADIAISINGVVKVQKGSSVATSTPGNTAIAIKASTAIAGPSGDLYNRSIAINHSTASAETANDPPGQIGRNRMTAVNYSTAFSYLGSFNKGTARNHSTVTFDGASSSVLLATGHSTAHTEHGSRNIVIAKRHSVAETGPASGAYVKAIGGSYASATASNTRAVAICGGHAVADEEGEHVFDNGGTCRKH